MRYNRILLGAGGLLMAGCIDDPVTVTDGPEHEVLPELALQVQQEVTAKYRARLKVTFEVGGELSPNTPITVHLEGVAAEDIDGGSVEVRLPTFAAMELAGPDKRPKYRRDGKAPVVASWTLPKMEAGDQWKGSVEIGSVAEKGYYQITAFVRADGDGKSHVFNDVFHERWLFIVGGGGMMTRVFDESVFPSGIVPQPGPFEEWLGSGAGGAGQTAAAMAAGNSSWFWVYAFTEDRHGDDIGMDGASLKAEYIERGQHVTTITRTVPADGIVKLPCTGYAEQHVSGRINNPTSSEVKGGQRLSYFQVRYSECGDTIDVRGARHYYLPYTFLVYAIPEIESHFGYDRSRMNWEWEDFDEDDEDPPSTYYSESNDKIVYRNFLDQHWISAHEFGHALHEEKLGGLWSAGCPSPHPVDEVSNYKCALQEGIADYAGNIGSPRNEWTYGSWENKHYTASPGATARSRATWPLCSTT